MHSPFTNRLLLPSRGPPDAWNSRQPHWNSNTTTTTPPPPTSRYQVRQSADRSQIAALKQAERARVPQLVNGTGVVQHTDFETQLFGSGSSPQHEAKLTSSNASRSAYQAQPHRPVDPQVRRPNPPAATTATAAPRTASSTQQHTRISMPAAKPPVVSLLDFSSFATFYLFSSLLFSFLKMRLIRSSETR